MTIGQAQLDSAFKLAESGKGHRLVGGDAEHLEFPDASI